jgi:N-acetylglucosamine kinase-like BadF-type ATPase
MTYVLGVDGGGTKTYAAIVSTSGDILGEGSAGPSNYHDVGVEATKANIASAITMASKRAELTKPEFAAAFLGLASIVSAADRDVVKSIAKDLQLPANDRLGIDHDCRIALAGGLSGRPGIVQIAGTGASTYGRNAEGKEWRSGGWGYLLADEGGGYWFGLNAMKAAVRAADGRSKETALRQLVIDRLKLATMDDIMHRLHVMGMSRSEIASLCPLLIDAAREGDQVALAVVEEGMAHIAECVETVAKRLGFDSTGDASFPPAAACELALVGGLFNAGDVVIEPLRKAIHRRLPNCSVILAELQPVLGACLLALNCLDISCPLYRPHPVDMP